LPEIECERKTVVAAIKATATNPKAIKRIMANLHSMETPAVVAALD
jgi:hypothetical protein